MNNSIEVCQQWQGEAFPPFCLDAQDIGAKFYRTRDVFCPAHLKYVALEMTSDIDFPYKPDNQELLSYS